MLSSNIIITLWKQESRVISFHHSKTMLQPKQTLTSENLTNIHLSLEQIEKTNQTTRFQPGTTNFT